MGVLSDSGYMHLSFHNGLYDSLYGFTTVESLIITKNLDGSWVLQFGQGIELTEQKYETVTYYVGKKPKTENRLVVSTKNVTAQCTL